MSTRKRSRGKSAPRYCHQKSSGQAYVSLNGKRHYLGKFDSEQSHERYRRLIAEKWRTPGAEKAMQEPSACADPENVSIGELAVIYAAHAKAYYRKNGKQTSEWPLVRLTLKKLRSLYGSMKASEFGPLRYQAFRQTFIDADLSRRTINMRALMNGGGNEESNLATLCHTCNASRKKKIDNSIRRQRDKMLKQMTK